MKNQTNVKDVREVASTLGFLESVIKRGGSWSDECEKQSNECCNLLDETYETIQKLTQENEKLRKLAGVFCKGDRVKLLSDKYYDSVWNPLWGENGRYIGGIVIQEVTNNNEVLVQWDNKKHNTYYSEDLKHLIEEDKKLISPLTEEEKKSILVIMPNARYVAMDENGHTYSFISKPEIRENVWATVKNEPVFRIRLLENYTDDWKNSLIEL